MLVLKNANGLLLRVDERAMAKFSITTKKARELANIIEGEIEKIRVTLGFTHAITINLTFSNPAHRWGQMRVLDRNFGCLSGEMNLSVSILPKPTNTIMHELLHLMPNGSNHNGKWKVYAHKINSAYGYNIKRCSSAEEKGVATVDRTKYTVYCPKCHTEWHYVRKTKAVQYPHMYLCCTCNCALERK